MQALNSDTQAILLLTAYFGKPTKGEPRPLTPTEWGRFAFWLKDKGTRPGDLLTGDPLQCLQGWQDRKIEPDRLQALLERGTALAVAVEKWQRVGIWIMTRSDPDYPRRLKQRLEVQSPPVLFGCGNRRLLNAGGIAVVGSRKANDEDLEFAHALGRIAAETGKTIISGGARGIDDAAMLGALEAEGTVIGVLADSLLRATVSQKYRPALRQQNLVLVSPFHPEAGFNAGNAMARNKYIYCLSDAAVVVHSGKSGGTWNGAMENLDKHWVPLRVKLSDDPKAGNRDLVKHGAVPSCAEELKDYLRSLFIDKDFPAAAPEDKVVQDVIRELELPTREPADTALETAEITENVKEKPSKDGSSLAGNEYLEGSLYEIFLLKLETLLGEQARKPKELEELLRLTGGQLKIWLNRAAKEGRIVKRTNPVRYELARAHSTGQLYMFDDY